MSRPPSSQVEAARRLDLRRMAAEGRSTRTKPSPEGGAQVIEGVQTHSFDEAQSNSRGRKRRSCMRMAKRSVMPAT